MRPAHALIIAIIVCLVRSAAPLAAQTTDPTRSDVGPENVWTLEGLWATRERPLFDPDRRPPAPPPLPVIARPAPPPPQPVEPAPSAPPPLVLTGIVIADDKAYAIVSERLGARPKTVQVGDDIAGWRVDQIAPRQIVMTSGSQRIVLDLKARVQPGIPGVQPVRQPVIVTPTGDD